MTKYYLDSADYSLLLHHFQFIFHLPSHHRTPFGLHIGSVVKQATEKNGEFIKYLWVMKPTRLKVYTSPEAITSENTFHLTNLPHVSIVLR
jgi:hypothetical protein